MAKIDELRKDYIKRICAEIIYLKGNGIASMADISSTFSRKVSAKLLEHLPYPIRTDSISGQTAGNQFEIITRDFLQDAFIYLEHIRPGKWTFSLHDDISGFDQYRHLNELRELLEKNKTFKAALGEYVFSPDIIVARRPVSDEDINKYATVVNNLDFPKYTPIRAKNNSNLILHASISCKWTIRTDRSQNSRTEGLNLIRNRKGHTPHIAVVTAEPTPGRLGSLALGTGDIDCVYYFALPELIEATKDTKESSAIESILMMVEGRRLRDISDLPFDLAI
jgi:hypothetical protein